jgi:hypothetical protein
MTADHRLLPPERRFASVILERQRTHRTTAIVRMERNYGPEGISLMASAIFWGLTGGCIGCVGLILLFLSGDHGPLLRSGYWLMGVGIVLEFPAIIRAFQGIFVARRFRQDSLEGVD